MTGWILFAALAGWLIGVAMSYRAVKRAQEQRRQAIDNAAGRFFGKLLANIDAVRISVVEDDVERDLTPEELEAWLTTGPSRRKH